MFSKLNAKPQRNTNLREIVYNFPNQALIGIYNKEKKQAYLAPAIPEKVWLLRNDNHQYERGWYILEAGGKFLRGTEVEDDKIKKYNENLDFVPRMYSSKENDDGVSYMTSHDYLLDLINDRENMENYFGFSVSFSDEKLNFVWVSGTLNNRDEQGIIIRDKNGIALRKRGALVPEALQDEIRDNITDQLEINHPRLQYT